MKKIIQISGIGQIDWNSLMKCTQKLLLIGQKIYTVFTEYNIYTIVIQNLSNSNRSNRASKLWSPFQKKSMQQAVLLIQNSIHCVLSFPKEKANQSIPRIAKFAIAKLVYLRRLIVGAQHPSQCESVTTLTTSGSYKCDWASCRHRQKAAVEWSPMHGGMQEMIRLTMIPVHRPTIRRWLMSPIYLDQNTDIQLRSIYKERWATR